MIRFILFIVCFICVPLFGDLAQSNLALAEQFLSDIALADNVVELEKGKLYYKRISLGRGKPITLRDKPTLRFSLRTLGQDGDVEMHTTQSPIQVDLSEVIPGFARGVEGMKEGEKRLIFIHPELAYGAKSSKFPPNILLIYTVELMPSKS